jgi:hypothetical protein
MDGETQSGDIGAGFKAGHRHRACCQMVGRESTDRLGPASDMAKSNNTTKPNEAKIVARGAKCRGGHLRAVATNGPLRTIQLASIASSASMLRTWHARTQKRAGRRSRRPTARNRFRSEEILRCWSQVHAQL